MFYCIPFGSFLDCITPALMIDFCLLIFFQVFFLLLVFFGLILLHMLLVTWKLPHPLSIGFYALSLAAITVVRTFWRLLLKGTTDFSKLILGEEFWCFHLSRDFVRKCVLDGRSAAALVSESTHQWGRLCDQRSSGWSFSRSLRPHPYYHFDHVGWHVESYKGLGNNKFKPGCFYLLEVTSI